jgi:hypothetical protein
MNIYSFTPLSTAGHVLFAHAHKYVGKGRQQAACFSSQREYICTYTTTQDFNTTRSLGLIAY